MENGENAGPAEDESTILTEGRSRPFCVVCQVEIVDSLKAIKQHLKSKPHKAALKEGGGCRGAVGRGRRGRRGTQEEDGGESGEAGNGVDGVDGDDEPCELCRRTRRTDTRHSMAAFQKALEAGLEVTPCFPPPFERAPKALFPGCKTPFVSLQSGRLDAVPNDLEECLDLYCNAGANDGNKPPNIDVNGENIKTKSLSNARRSLMQASSAGEVFWAALVVDSIQHPPWWPRPKKDTCACCDDGDVPNFNQVIIGSGETDIGIHIDNAPKPCGGGGGGAVERDFDLVDIDDPQYQHCLSKGGQPVHVDTYITMARGLKHVIMLPSGGNFFGEKSRFPCSVSPGLMQQILDHKGSVEWNGSSLGSRSESISTVKCVCERESARSHATDGVGDDCRYFFKLEPVDDEQHVTLFTPKGWHHWLLGQAEWHLIFGASRF